MGQQDGTVRRQVTELGFSQSRNSEGNQPVVKLSAHPPLVLRNLGGKTDIPQNLERALGLFKDTMTQGGW